MTRVVNLYKEKFDVYIGRPGKGMTGYYGNPVVVGCTCPVCEKIHNSGGETIACYQWYFLERLGSDEEFKLRVEALRGKTLGCFCKPKPCHGDVIVAYLETKEIGDVSDG